MRCRPTCVVVFYIEKNHLATFYLTCDHFRDMTQPISAFNLVFVGMTHVESAYSKLNDKRSPLYKTTLKGRKSLIPELLPHRDYHTSPL